MFHRKAQRFREFKRAWAPAFGHQTRSVFERYNVTRAGDLHAAARKLTGTVRAQTAPEEGAAVPVTGT